MSRMRTLAVIVGVVGHLVAGVWFAASGLVAPPWAVVVLLVAWVGLAVALWRLARRRSGWSAGIPIIDAAFWLAFIETGAALFDWTA
jgi:hypothetical protein